MGIINKLILNGVEYDIGESGTELTDDAKVALLQLAQKMAYIDEDGQDYYDDLYDALYPPADLVSISAVYTQSGVVYDTASLDDLRTDLVVTAHMSDSTTRTVTAYALSGTLTTGTSTITVTYGGKTTTFTVTVTHQPVYTQLITDAGTFVQSGVYANNYNGAPNTNVKCDVYTLSNVQAGDVITVVTGWNTGSDSYNSYISTAEKTMPNYTDINFTAHPYSYGILEVTVGVDYNILYVGLNNNSSGEYKQYGTWEREGGF